MPGSSRLLPASAYFAQGAGLPCDRIRRDLGNAGFTQITGPSDSQQASELWIVTHQDLKNTARIRAFLSAIGDAIVADRRCFEGMT